MIDKKTDGETEMWDFKWAVKSKIILMQGGWDRRLGEPKHWGVGMEKWELDSKVDEMTKWFIWDLLMKGNKLLLQANET